MKLLSVIASFLGCVAALDNGVGLTPAMGWNSWNRFRCEGLNEDLIKEVASAIVSTGLRDAGYQYVNIDDCWMEKRGPDGHIIPFASKFPSGMKALGDFIHGLGLKFGIYSCAGNKTCEGFPASFGYEAIDAADYASWGVDYLKYDYCGMETHADANTLQGAKKYYTVMRDALNATGRPILYSLCNWGMGQPHLWGMEVANSWRTGRDVFATWDERETREVLRLPGFLQSIETAIEQQAGYAENAGPGGFNDPDMLVVGLDGMTPYGIVEQCPSHLPAGTCKKGDYISREAWGEVGGLTMTEQRAQFGFWAMLASPLILGNDPRRMRAAEVQVLTAREVIVINQDAAGRQAVRVHSDGRISIWVKALASGDHALLLHNGNAAPADITTRWGRDLAEAARPFAETVAREPPCANKYTDEGCAGWVKAGECTKNPGYMQKECAAACGSCPPALWEAGSEATALVRDAWAAEYLGTYTAQFTAKHVEPHEARLLVVRFARPGPPGRDALEKLVRDERRARGGKPGRRAARLPGRKSSRLLDMALEDEEALPARKVPSWLTPGGQGDSRVAPHPRGSSLSACGRDHLDALLLLAAGAALAAYGCGRMCGGGARPRQRMPKLRDV
jgi:alpha-galactosidase